MNINHLVAASAAAALAVIGSTGLAQAKPQAMAAGQPNESVWHLRAGLNVAALSCRGSGRERVAPAYSRLLSRHRGLLASSYALEQRRYGAGLDRHQTQLYNRFALQRSPERFCASASDVADQAVAMDSTALAKNAGSLLSRID